MSDVVVAVCPSCSQKYRVCASTMGMRARCKRCGQPFRLLEEPPIDDETVFGWVTEEDPAGASVLGGTGLFGSSFNESTQVPANNQWTRPAPPAEPRVVFEGIGEEGASFSFPVDGLRSEALRLSLPHRCAQCLVRDDLEIHLVIWPEKVPPSDAALITETETRAHRSLAAILQEHGLNWFSALKSITTLPAPYDAPFPYCVCPQCSVIGSVRGRVVEREDEPHCQLIIAHPSIALDFYRNNGGRETPGYKKLLVASRQRRDNQWKSLAVGVRKNIGQWFTARGDERFLGYYSDRDFGRSDRGTAGVVLTDKRMVYHKYAALREYPLDAGGTLEIEASKSKANVEIIQGSTHVSILATTPLAASSLARSLTSMKEPWDIKVAPLE